MRERVEQAVAAGIVSAPSEEQWAMILGRSPLTRIFAGAGSGKSTTLLLRVVFMLCHLGIEPGRLTVISFTNASCGQLREQLLRVLAFWQFPFDERQARQCVRTFHSAMAQLAREVLGTAQWFEQLDDKAAAGDEPDNPLANARLRPAQQRLLKQAYQRCYAEQPDFREQVHRLLDLPGPAVEPAKGRRAAPKAPEKPFSLAGEFAALPLYEAFHVQAGFIESIGLRIDRLQPSGLECTSRERQFIEALIAFHGCFQAVLREQGLQTFNAAFQQLGETANRGQRRAQLIAHVRHELRLDPVRLLQRACALAQHLLGAAAVGDVQHREQRVAVGQRHGGEFEMPPIRERHAPAALLALDGGRPHQLADQRRPVRRRRPWPRRSPG